MPPTFFQSHWFKLICALALVALAWGAYQLRLRHITQRMRTRFEGRISERERIARELHDTLLQGVQGLVLHFQAAAKRVATGQPAQAMIEEALLRADTVLAESRERVHELRRPTGQEDLAEAWVAIAAEFAALAHADFTITVEGTGRRLRPMVYEEVQRIGEEALRNAYQHSQAQNISVTLTYQRHNLFLLVRDDGEGVPADVASAGERKGHYGLVGMRERARRIGGTLSIVSCAGRGTELSLSMPARAAYAEQSSRWWLPAPAVTEWEHWDADKRRRESDPHPDGG
jgi:signal transduction histidine kinase